MSASRTAARKHVDRRDGKSDAPAVRTFEPKPFKPHRRLFALLAVVLLIWIAVLIVMYVKTVRNARPPTNLQFLERDALQFPSIPDEPNPTTRPGASGLPSAPR